MKFALWVFSKNAVRRWLWKHSPTFRTVFVTKFIESAALVGFLFSPEEAVILCERFVRTGEVA